ncbi:MAG: tRNA (adenosine(37)-N6)-threonylcarbamoyltransferase complex ATPase subunit type 1 TsaE [Desulfuromonadaceae bacterium]|nr:tRNA (adenosine(37)-N6)-threonylcarbamoyltransferase complex ATPase subunit type 1 TsaE [Desulfuromonadaceae bacterium]
MLNTLLSHSPQQTLELGRRLGEHLTGGALILLKGELGAGKTCFAAGLAHGLGVAQDRPITSPTYALMNSYQGRLPFYHFDLYRLADEDELLELGFDEYFFGEGVALVEWPERCAQLEANALLVELIWQGEMLRQVSFSASDDFIRNNSQLCAAIRAF